MKLAEGNDTAQGSELVKYFDEKVKADMELDSKLKEFAGQLAARFPKGLEETCLRYIYQNDAFTEIDLTRWLSRLYDDTKNGIYSGLPWVQKEPDDEWEMGFRDGDDKYEKLMRVKDAWAGLVEIELVRSGEGYVKEKVKLPVSEAELPRAQEGWAVESVCGGHAMFLTAGPIEGKKVIAKINFGTRQEIEKLAEESGLVLVRTTSARRKKLGIDSLVGEFRNPGKSGGRKS